MYGLYDRDGILRFVNPEREACLDYAKLFELKSTQYCLINIAKNIDEESDINLVLNQAKSNN